MQDKILGDFIPYNEIFYINCFYNNLFPIVEHYKKNIKSFYSNVIISYDMFDDRYLSIKYIEDLKWQQVLLNMGIGVNSKNICDNIANEICTAIDKERPVIINVDSYYEPINTQHYLKKHMEHMLLIYGYKESNMSFEIIETNDIDNLMYKNNQLSFNDIEKSYNGYVANFNKRNKTFHEFFLLDDTNINSHSEDYLEIFQTNLFKYKGAVLNGINLFGNFINKFEKYIMKEDVLKENINDILLMLNTIITAKRLTVFTFTNLNYRIDILNVLNEIIKLWSLIRKTLVVYSIREKYEIIKMEYCVVNLNVIYRLEKECYLKELYK